LAEADADRGVAAAVRRMSGVFLALASVGVAILGVAILEGFASLRRIRRILERQERAREHEMFLRIQGG